MQSLFLRISHPRRGQGVHIWKSISERSGTRVKKLVWNNPAEEQQKTIRLVLPPRNCFTEGQDKECGLYSESGGSYRRAEAREWLGQICTQEKSLGCLERRPKKGGAWGTPVDAVQLSSNTGSEHWTPWTTLSSLKLFPLFIPKTSFSPTFNSGCSCSASYADFSSILR